MDDEEPTTSSAYPGASRAPRAPASHAEGPPGAVAFGQWVERGAYRFKAPSAEKKAETERIQRGDDASIALLRERKRSGLVATSERLGSLGDVHVDMQEARRRFLEAKEKEVDPVQRRLRRREEEAAKKREEQQRRKVEQDKMRFQWQQRQQKEAAKSQLVNAAKRSHWQAWAMQEQATHAPASRTSDASSNSAEAHTHDPLASSSSPLVTDAVSSATPHSALEQCIVCEREACATTQTAEFAHICQTCLEESAMLERSASALNEQWHCIACTLANPREAARCSACGNRRPESMPIVDSESLQDGHHSCQQLDTVDASVASSHTSEKPMRARMVGAPGLHGGVDPGDASMTQLTRSPLLTWLRTHELEHYYDRMIEQGYEHVEDLKAMASDDLEEMFKLIEAKPGHKVRFRKALRDSPGARECPVCLAGLAEGVDVAVTPCGHVFCSAHAAKAVEHQVCPVCRGAAVSAQRVFI